LTHPSPIVVPGPTELAETAARCTADIIQAAVEQRGRSFWALAGGKTPWGCYERLAQEPYRSGIPWPKLLLFWSDERQVPLDDPASNYGMARAALLDHVPVRADQVYPFQDVDTYRRLLEQLPKDGQGVPRFDLIHLGMGEDGHTASLFPGDTNPSEPELVRSVIASRPPPRRLTFTLRLINAARFVLFLVQGAGKRGALAEVLRQNAALPAALVRPADGEVRFIVDRAAFPGEP
jgi:6-phosphogluconolactonase